MSAAAAEPERELEPVSKEIRALRRDELALATETLTLAFEDDPLFRHFHPEAKARKTWLTWFHRSSLNECFRAGGAFTIGGPENGVMGLMPPGVWPIPLMKSLRDIKIPFAIPSWNFLRNGLHLEGRIRSLHPPEPHLYVNVLGVHPRLKGRGLGAALMRHAWAMALEHPLYLETANPVNLPFYRRFGLEVEVEIDSHGGPPVWTMKTRTP